MLLPSLTERSRGWASFINCRGWRVCLLLFSLFISNPTVAQERDSVSHWGFSASISPGRLIVMDDYQKRWQRKKQTMAFAVEANHTELPSDDNPYASDFNYPLISFGAKLNFNDITMHRSPDPAWGMAQEVDYDSRMGNVLTAYATFTRTIYRQRHWSFDYSLGTGISYAEHKYSNGNNIDNELIGSRFLVYFTCGLHATYRFARQWGVMGGVEFYHHSNGALNRPNKGANIVGPVLGVRYMPYYDEVLNGAKTATASTKQFNRYWFVNIGASIGAKTLNEDWQLTQFHTHPDSARYRTGRFRMYTAYALQADVMWRYARRWATGLGTDLFYGTYADRVKEVEPLLMRQEEPLKVSPWSWGLALKHHVYYGNLSAQMSLGYYLYRHMGTNAKEVEQPYYERIGVHYSFPKLGGLSIGASIKAHLTKADLTELTVSMPIVLTRNRR